MSPYANPAEAKVEKRQKATESFFLFFLFLCKALGLSSAQEIENLMHLKQVFLTPSLLLSLLRGRMGVNEFFFGTLKGTSFIDTIN